MVTDFCAVSIEDEGNQERLKIEIEDGNDG
jgi:hypothetical protein